MKIKLLSALIAVAATTGAQYATASDGNIVFMGTVSQQTCVVDNASRALTIALPEVSKDTLRTAGKTAGATPFEIRVKGCPTDTGTVTAHFEPGVFVDAATGRINNTTSPGAAGNVQIQLLNPDMSPIIAGGTDASSKPVALEGAAASMRYFARYYAKGTVTPGHVQTAVQYSVIYN